MGLKHVLRATPKKRGVGEKKDNQKVKNKEIRKL